MRNLLKAVDQMRMNVVPPDVMLELFSYLYQQKNRYLQHNFMQSTLGIVDSMRQSEFFSTEIPDKWEKLDSFLKQLMREYVKIRVAASQKNCVICITPKMETQFKLSAHNGRALANFITTANLYKTENTYITLREFVTRCKTYFGFFVNIESIESEEYTNNIAYIESDQSHSKVHHLGLIKPKTLASLSDFFLTVIYNQTETRDKRLNAIFSLVFLYGSSPHVIQNKLSLVGGAFATDFLLQYLLVSIGEKPIRKNYLTLTEVELLLLFGQNNQDAWDTPRKCYLAACDNNDSNLFFHQGDSLSLLKMMISDDFGFIALAKKHSKQQEGQFHHVLFKMLAELSIEHRRVHFSNIYIPSTFAIKDPTKIMAEITRMKASIFSLQPEPEKVFDGIYKEVCGILTKATTSKEEGTGSFIQSLLEKIQAAKPPCREELLLHLEMTHLSKNNTDDEKQCLNECLRLILPFPSLEEFTKKCDIFDKNYMKTLHHKTLELLLEDTIKNKKLSAKNAGIVLSLVEGRQLLTAHWDDFKQYITPDGLHQPVIAEGEDQGKTPFYFLTDTPEGQKLLTAHWDDFKEHITTDGLHQPVIAEGADQGKTPFYFLTGTPEGQQLLTAHWDDFKEHITTDGLHQPVTGKGEDQGTTPFCFLTGTPEGQQLLTNRWDDFKEHITTDGLHQPVTGKGEDQGRTPFYFLTGTLEGRQLLTAHWNDFKEHITTDGLHQPVIAEGEEQGTTPFCVLTATRTGRQLLTNRWDDFKEHITTDGLHQPVTGKGEDQGKTPFYFLRATPEGQKLLTNHWDDFLKKGFDKRHPDEFNALINTPELSFEIKEKMCRAFLEKFKDSASTDGKSHNVSTPAHFFKASAMTTDSRLSDSTEIDGLITMIKALKDNKFTLNDTKVNLEASEKLITELNKYKNGHIDFDALTAFIDEHTNNHTHSDLLKIYFDLAHDLARQHNNTHVSKSDF